MKKGKAKSSWPALRPLLPESPTLEEAGNHQGQSKKPSPPSGIPFGQDQLKKTKTKTNPVKSQPVSPGLSLYWQWGLVLLVILFFAAIRIRLLNFPLERDEGEYSYAGQLILQGIPPYQIVYNMKLPGTYLAYSVILSLFGQSPAAVHLGLLIINAASSLLVFLLTRKMFGPRAGVVACASYALLSMSPAVLGFAGHATHFVVLPALGGLLLLLMATESKNLWLFFASGVLLGVAFMMKQPGVFFVLFAGLYLIRSEWTVPAQWRNLASRVAAYSFGALTPFALTCFILYRAGLFRKFWFWTFSYASAYGTIVSGREGLHHLSVSFSQMVILAVGIWIFAAVGLIAVIWNRKLRPRAPFAAGYLLFSFIAVSAGLYYRPHYFVLMLPAAAMLTGVAVCAMQEKLPQFFRSRFVKFLPALLFLLAFASSVYVLRQFFFEVDPLLACRMIYALEPFPEALEVAKYIESHAPQGARIAVIGSEPEIYFYSRRHSATGYIYTYALFEEQKYAVTMQKEMIREIEAAQPFFLILCQGPAAHWGLKPGSETMVFDWVREYVVAHYALTGTVDVGYTSEYHWDEDVKNAPFLSPIRIMVFRRIS
jgi:hypothetical protein